MNTRLKVSAFWLLIPLTAPAQLEPEPVETELHVELLDGSLIKGKPELSALKIQSQFGDVSVPLDRIRRWDHATGQKTITLTLTNRDVIKGSLADGGIEIDSLLGRLSVGFDQVKSCAVLRLTKTLRELRDNIVLHYTFDQDLPVPENNVNSDLKARVEKATWIAEGRIGGAYTFADNQKFIEIDDHKALSPEHITLACWVRLDQHGGGYHGAVVKSTAGVWGDGYGLSMYAGDNEHINFFVNSYSSVRVQAPIELNKWTHFVGTYDGHILSIYKNGEWVQSRDYNQPLKRTDYKMYVGQGRLKGYTWMGAVDDVMLLNRALNPKEIKQLYQQFSIP